MYHIGKRKLNMATTKGVTSNPISEMKLNAKSFHCGLQKLYIVCQSGKCSASTGVITSGRLALNQKGLMKSRVLKMNS